MFKTAFIPATFLLHFCTFMLGCCAKVAPKTRVAQIREHVVTISRRVRRNGSIAYKAEVRKMRNGQKYQRTRTFDKLAHAKAWEAKELSEASQADNLVALSHRGVTVGKLIADYQEDYGQGFGRTKKADIQALAKADLAALPAMALTSGQLIDHVRSRRLTVAASTALNDLIWLRAVWRFARTAKGIPVDFTPLDDALAFCRSERLVAKSRRRERRPTAAELKHLTSHFAAKRGEVPMVDILWFAVHSARREAEICALLWSDNHDGEMTGLVRDAKHPREKEGNHRRFKYTPEGWEIVQRQPSGREGRIFPFNPKTVGAYFTDACHVLEIEDLRFHDLRHEATSRLFELGYSIVEVQQFTLHEDWNTLKLYTHLRPGAVRHR
jgi:integrase